MCTPGSTATSSPTGPPAPRRRIIRAPRMWLRHFSFVSRRGGAFPQDRVKILSTGGMLDAARATRAREVLVATEVGMLYQLRRAAPRWTSRPSTTGIVQVHENDHPRRAAALPARRRRRGRRGSETSALARRSVQRMIEIGQPGGGE
ncbi:quinolinate synthetase A family protein [Mycobacterium xenopi 4042]|uniref:Quinolinate synthetase A family protein n=1 Tax=Mycobacterium xenopi 4042 TaxID=1299334 RepID=X8DIJ8_MYCXE|nr:quinolinate synthetase A family protein [Mycobacterium xenopi 4042]